MYRLKCSIDACSLLADSGRRSSEEMASLCSYDDQLRCVLGQFTTCVMCTIYSSVFMFFCAKSATQKTFIHGKNEWCASLLFFCNQQVEISPYNFNRASFVFMCCR